MHVRLSLAPLVALSLAGLLSGAQARDLPKWELGLGLADVSLPDYRGSDERRQFVVPTPYLVYRGDTVKADREGTRAQLWSVGDAHLDIYLGGSLPVSSSRNQARTGMAPLQSVLDIGPALDIKLSESADERRLIKLRVPAFYGLTLSSPRRGLGWQSNPAIHVYDRDVMGWSGWNSSVATGPMFATGQRNAYLYNVKDSEATPERPAYRSHGGYAGWMLSASLSRRFEQFWVGAYARYENLSNASYADSPMVRSRQYLAGGLAFIWVLGESSERVSVD